MSRRGSSRSSRRGWAARTLPTGLLGLALAVAGCDRDDATSPTPDVAESAPTSLPETTGEIPSERETGSKIGILEGQGITAGGSYLVRWRSGPDGIPALDPFSLEVEVESTEGLPLAEDATVLMDAAMPHHGHGMNFVPEVVRTAPGRYRVEGMLFHMRGRWELFVDVERDGVLERAQWTVELE